MKPQRNISLKPFNSFGIDVTASFFIQITSKNEIAEFIAMPEYKNQPLITLGGGSNVLFTENFPGVVLKNEIKGIALTKENKTHVFLKAGAGENWHGLVNYCIDRNYAGIENLSLIPGCVGAAPIQNIGAYGVELESVFEELSGVYLDSGVKRIFTKSDCHFGYRNSIFKNKLKGNFFICDVTLKLKKVPEYNISYGALKQEIEKAGIKELTLRGVSDAVCNIRRSKLPDPAMLGNAGSFFKNPVVTNEKFQLLKMSYPNIAGYKSSETEIKLAAGWLIEQCGWKGFRDGDAGVHAQQALVLVNYGKATGKELIALAARIADSVQETFGVELEREVNLI